MQQNSTALWTLGIIGVSAFMLIAFLFSSRESSPNPELTKQDIPVVADDHVKGAATSTVVLVEYLDFECEACGAYYPIVTQLQEEYGDRVKFVARYFPLPSHRNGLPAALAAEAAGRQGKFWEMHDLLFTRQATWGEKQAQTPEVFEAYAQELGLDMEKFRADVASAEVTERVARDIEQGQQLGVNSTPTFFLNGKQVRAPSIEAFRTLLDAELQASGA